MVQETLKEVKERELKAPASFTSPEELYQDMIKTIYRYHPSDDITLIEKAYRTAIKSRNENRVNLISFTLFVLPLFWQI